MDSLNIRHKEDTLVVNNIEYVVSGHEKFMRQKGMKICLSHLISQKGQDKNVRRKYKY